MKGRFGRRLFARKPRPLDPRVQARVDDFVRRTSPEVLIAELERDTVPMFQRETLDFWSATPQLRKPEPQLLITSTLPTPEQLRDQLDRARDEAPHLNYLEWSAPTPWGDRS